MDKVEKFMAEMEKRGDGGWSYQNAKDYIGADSLDEAIDNRQFELDEFNRGIQVLVDTGWDLEYLLRKPK